MLCFREVLITTDDYFTVMPLLLVKDISMSMFNMGLRREKLEMPMCAAEAQNLAGISLNLFVFENTVKKYTEEVQYNEQSPGGFQRSGNRFILSVLRRSEPVDFDC